MSRTRPVVYTGGAGGRLRAWDHTAGTSQTLRVCPDESFLLALYATLDDRLFVGTKRGSIVAVSGDLQTATIVWARSKSAVRQIAGSSDPSKLLVASDTHEVYLLDLEKPEAPTHRMFEGHSYVVTDILPLPDSTQFITSSLDKSIRHWDTRSGYIGEFVNMDDKLVWSMAFLPQSNEVVLGADSGELLAYSR